MRHFVTIRNSSLVFGIFAIMRGRKFCRRYLCNFSKSCSLFDIRQFFLLCIPMILNVAFYCHSGLKVQLLAIFAVMRGKKFWKRSFNYLAKLEGGNLNISPHALTRFFPRVAISPAAAVLPHRLAGEYVLLFIFIISEKPLVGQGFFTPLFNFNISVQFIL